MLQVDELETAYGPIRALDGVSFEVEQGSITAVLGANGAGKTSLLRTLSGLVRARAGRIRLDGRNIGQLPVERIVRLGMAHVPEGRGVIAELSVEDNLRLGGLWRGGGGRDGLAAVYETFPRLGERGAQPASTLSGGERQMLVIGRALMSGLTVLLVEQNAKAALSVADRGIVLSLGRIVADDEPRSLAADDALRHAYLGF
jgi:branched-chain amino acid transport system ATP-binding protein